MQLPNVNKNGKPYLSWSSIELFYKNTDEWWSRYVDKKPFVPNKWTDFGSKVGQALETGNFENFEPIEQMTLNKVVRLDNFEERVVLDFGDFEIVGFVDSANNDFSHIIDYKTGGQGKEDKYIQPSYLQMHLYACAIRQMYGYAPNFAEVHYITRTGKNDLKVAYKSPIVLQMDIREGVLDKVEDVMFKAFQDISEYYLSRLN